jgi:tetratricopeptide (TPR) repeat protein
MSRVNLAGDYGAAGRTSDAMEVYESTVRRYEATLGPDHPNTLTGRTGLAWTYDQIGRCSNAEDLYRDVLNRRRKKVKPDSPLLADDLAALGENLLNQSRWSEAEPLLSQALTIREKATPEDLHRFHAMSLLGGALLGLGRHAEAEPLVVSGYEGTKAREAQIAVSDRSRLREAAERVVHLYDGWGRSEQAAAWKARVGMPDLPVDVFALR